MMKVVRSCADISGEMLEKLMNGKEEVKISDIKKALKLGGKIDDLWGELAARIYQLGLKKAYGTVEKGRAWYLINKEVVREREEAEFERLRVTQPESLPEFDELFQKLSDGYKVEVRPNGEDKYNALELRAVRFNGGKRLGVECVKWWDHNLLGGVLAWNYVKKDLWLLDKGAFESVIAGWRIAGQKYSPVENGVIVVEDEEYSCC